MRYIYIVAAALLALNGSAGCGNQSGSKNDTPSAVAASAADMSADGLRAELARTIGSLRTASPDGSNAAAGAGPTDLGEWLERLAAAYDAKREPLAISRFALGDAAGTAVWATALAVEPPPQSDGRPASRQAVAVIVSAVDGGFRADTVPLPEGDSGLVRVEAVGDLTGDGVKEIVWRWGTTGAHTTTFGYTVSQRSSDGGWSVVPGTVGMPSVESFTLENGALVLQGGLIGSAGAGPWQRERTETYRYEAGAMKLADSVASEGATAYHRLEDAVASESLGHRERAVRQYAEAARATDDSYKGLLFEYGGGVIEGGGDPQLEVDFGAAVRALAAVRHYLLELDGTRTEVASDSSAASSGMTGPAVAGTTAPIQAPPLIDTRTLSGLPGLAEALKGASNREQAAETVKRWAEEHPEWLKLLNAPYGYANRKWTAESASGIPEQPWPQG
ncbi:VCBS repeat-containing protein [Paenibacillus hodogayensis]|uniref:VCBS repeat-containing protein n=1 Tax=Paenibacillus hodogayensis TaxID=279208 RepID=A0ABV5VQQ3_9BACL